MDLNNFHLKKHEKVISPTRLPEISIIEKKFWKERPYYCDNWLFTECFVKLKFYEAAFAAFFLLVGSQGLRL